MEELGKLKSLLDDQYDWPAEYLFKFIVPTEQLGTLESLVSDYVLSEKSSKTGKYKSVTFTGTFKSSQEVLEIYKKVTGIPGIMSL